MPAVKKPQPSTFNHFLFSNDVPYRFLFAQTQLHHNKFVVHDHIGHKNADGIGMMCFYFSGYVKFYFFLQYYNIIIIITTTITYYIYLLEVYSIFFRFWLRYIHCFFFHLYFKFCNLHIIIYNIY